MKRGLAWFIASMVIGAIGSLIVTPVLIHTLGSVEFGLYILVLTVTSYAGFLDLGITWAATRYFAEDIANGRSHELSSRFHTLARFLIGVGVFSAVLATALGPVLVRAAGEVGGAELVLVFFLAAVSFGFALQSGLIVSFLRAGQRFGQAGRVAVVGNLLLPLGCYAAARLSPSLVLLMAVNAGVNLIGMLLGFLMARSQLSLAQNITGWQPRYLWEMASFGGWSTIGRLVMLIILQVDRLAVALVGSVSGLTYYAVPANLASRVNTLGGPTASLFFSRASLLHAGGQSAELRGQHASMRRLLIWSTLAAAIPLIMLGPDFLRVWIGSEMAARGGGILRALTVGYAIIAITSPSGAVLEGCRRPDITVKAMLAWGAVSIAGVVAFAPSLGSQAIAHAVATWLGGVGVTNAVMARRLVIGSPQSGRGYFLMAGVLLSLAVALFTGSLLRPLIHDLQSGLLAMAAMSAASLAVGFFLILADEERRILLQTLKRPRPTGHATAEESDRKAEC